MNKLSFGEKNIVAEGPMAEAAELKENGRIVISFRQGTGSLKQAKSLEGIAIAANDGKYKFVEAYTEGDKVIALWNGKEYRQASAMHGKTIHPLPSIIQKDFLHPVSN